MSRRKQLERSGQTAVLEGYRSEELTSAENKLRSDLATISALWNEMLTPPARRQGSDGSGGGGALLEDDSEDVADMPRVVTVVAARVEVCYSLAQWCREIVAAHRVKHSIPPAQDAVKMAQFLTRWSSQVVELDDVEELLDDVRTCASIVERCAQPQRKDWMSLGPCPLRYENPESGSEEQCPGEVRSWGADVSEEATPLALRDDDEQSWATCSACGAKAVASWWETQMFGEEREAPLTTEEVITFVHRAYGRPVTRTAVQKWVSRGDLASCGTDERGRRLYDRTAVAWAMDRQEKRRGKGSAR